MYSFELFEAPKNIVVLYAGRFQPFHKGHRAVYEYLVKKFGRDAVYVSTSNKTDADKSPFTFSDKAYFMQIQGIPMDRVRETNQPYQNPELVKTFDPENTALIVAVSDKDKDRFGKIGYKKDGSLSFFQDIPNELGDMAPLSQHGYVMTVPTFDFTVYGKPMRSATEVRAMYRAANEQVRREIIKDLFGKWTQEAEQIMNAKLQEDIMPASADTISPVHESWSKKYKKSIDCSNPKGFSQKAHCAGRRARQGGKKTKSQSVSENLEGRMIDLTKNFPTYTSLIGRITKENPTKVTIETIQADGPGNIKVGDELRIATNYIKRLPITESHHTDIPSMLEKFLPIAMKELGIAKLPSIKLTKHLKPHGTQASFGMYNPDDGKIYLAVADRHPVDILRTLAHELVHFSQDGKHELDADSGETGSREENEANSVAGVIMRQFNNEFPDAIKSEPLLAENLLNKATPTPQEIMQKHGMTDQEFMQQLRLGRAVEMEHTNNPRVAIEIALDHINERPDYYTMLKSVERPMGENKKKDKSVGELEQTLRNPHSYKAIDHAMQSIARKYKISASELHDKFVKHHGTIPDNWAKKLEEFVTANYGIGKSPGVLARVGPKGQVPRAKLHVNVPKKTAVKLGIPHTHLKEAFDAPYPMDWEHGDDDESYDALVTLPDGTNMSIMFSKEYGDYGEEEWQVEFYRNNSQDVTGEGDAQRIFATVLSAIQQFIKLEKPKRIKFSAAKQTGDMTPNTSRTSLYNRLVQRFANNLGYGVKTTDYSLNTVYELERLREGVAEGSDNLSYIGNCTDDDVIEHIFGDATGFAQAVDEYGDEFVLDDLVVKYDPETDIHSFYYKKQGVAEVNAAGELSVDPDLIERFTNRGWEIDGEGRDQIVLSKPGSNTVLKIVGQGSLPRQAEIRRYVTFFRANQRNPHFPRVGLDRELTWKGRKYYAYTQERLLSLPGDEAVLDYLEKFIGNLDQNTAIDERDIPDGLTYEQIDGLVQAIDRMFSAGFMGDYDLANSSNIMQRDNGQLVIVDPFSSHDDELSENFADGKVKGKSRPGRVKAAGASCKGSVTDLRARAKKYSGERGKMYHWCANMKAGRK